jgi:hypothetical protein
MTQVEILINDSNCGNTDDTKLVGNCVACKLTSIEGETLWIKKNGDFVSLIPSKPMQSPVIRNGTFLMAYSDDWVMARSILSKFEVENLIVNENTQDASWTKVKDYSFYSEGIFFFD